MRMFQSVSRHSSEYSTAHNSSWPTISQLKGVSNTISNWFENHRPQGTQISTVTYAPFRSKLESNGLQVDRNRKFSERSFQLLQYSGLHPSFSAYWADLTTKTDSTFPAFSLRIVDFAVQFLLRCKFSFLEKRHSSQVWQWRDLLKPITILCQRTATNGIALFCIDHKWRQMAFFSWFLRWGAPTFARLTWNKAAFMLPCSQTSLFFEGQERAKDNGKGKRRETSGNWTDARQHGIYLLNRNLDLIILETRILANQRSYFLRTVLK